nr:poly(R)-hydroxyalkanoic acid synthase subunit PhaE [Marinobacterium ramblicola]
MQQWMTQLERSTEGSDSASSEPWWQLLQERMPDDQLPPQQAELLALLTQQSLEFTRFGQQLISQLEQNGSHSEMSGLVNQFHNHLRHLTQEWILKRWQLPEQLGALFRTHSFQDDLLLDNPFIHGMKSLLNTPSLLGLQHSMQRQMKEGIDLLIDYEQALRDYSAHYAEINTGATSRFLEQIEASDPAIASLGQLHDLWVEAYEGSYAERIATPGYRDAHGRISNAVMSLRHFLQELRNTQLQQLGIPSNTQMELIYQRLNDQRRELKQLRREVAALSSLREEIAQLKRRSAPSGKANRRAPTKTKSENKA